MTEITPEAIRARMLEIETRFGDDHAGLGVVAARMLGVEPSDEFDRALGWEVGRTELLCAQWYARRVAVLPNGQAIAAAMVQGLTFALAVQELQREAAGA